MLNEPPNFSMFFRKSEILFQKFLCMNFQIENVFSAFFTFLPFFALILKSKVHFRFYCIFGFFFAFLLFFSFLLFFAFLLCFSFFCLNFEMVQKKAWGVIFKLSRFIVCSRKNGDFDWR